VCGAFPDDLRIVCSADLGLGVVQSDIGGIVRDSARVFEKLGHRVEEIRGGPPPVSQEWALLNAFEVASLLHPLLPEHEENFGRGFLRGIKAGWQMSPEILGVAGQLRMQLSNWCSEVFSEHDLLITPTVPFDPPPAKGPLPSETEGRPQPAWGVAAFTIPFNFSWNPAATVRAGISRAGLPVGLQIIGPQRRDDLVLQAARAFECEQPWHPNWPTVW
jgi:aspartyl-tRNA(Asn)/glutamyl-tRNA(Gln) amidotransferase subunit A